LLGGLSHGGPARLHARRAPAPSTQPGRAPRSSWSPAGVPSPR